MSAQIKVADIRGFFGGQKSVSTVAVGKAVPKKEKEKAAEAETDAVAGSKRKRDEDAVESDVHKSPRAASSPARAKPGTPAREKSSAKRPRTEAAEAVEAAGTSSARRRPSKTGENTEAAEDKPVEKAGSANRKRGSRAATVAESEDDDGVVVSRPKREAVPRVSHTALFADESSESDTDMRISAVKRTVQKPAEPVKPRAVSPVKAKAAPVPAPVVERVKPAKAQALHERAADVSAADFFGGAVVSKGATSTVVEPAPASPPRKATKTAKPTAKVPSAPRTSATEIMNVDDFDDLDFDDAAFAVIDATTSPPVKPAASTATPIKASAQEPATASVTKSIAAAKQSPAPSTVSTPAPSSNTTPATMNPLQPIVAGLRVPKGAPGALKNTKWVLTGELDNLAREAAIGCIRQYGGEVVTAVSGKVDHLLVGSRLEDGRPVDTGSKYQKALQLNADKNQGIKFVTESEFFALLDATLPESERAPIPVPMAAPKLSAPSRLMSDVQSASSAPQASSTSEQEGFHELWVDKYKPRGFEDLVGNQRELLALDDWLKKWDAIHLHKTLAPPKFSMQSNSGAKAVLISGPPGIGKTTTAALIAKRYGYDLFEMNASDARSKNKLKDLLEQVTDNTSVASYFSSAPQSAQANSTHLVRRLIVMDEVDGMSAGDRGGNAELCKIIRETRTPIVCICNDRMKQSVRTLVRYCYDIKFQPPKTEQIAARLMQIAAIEGIAIEPQALNSLIESCGGDLRQCINTLQMWTLTHKSISGSQMKSRMSSVSKDANLRLDAFSAAPRMFSEAKTTSLDARMELFFVDYDMIPLLVQQAYVTVIEKSTGPDVVKMNRCARAAEAISDCDIYTEYVRNRQAWGLLPSVAAGNVRATGWAAGPPPFLMFPTFLGKNSSRNKKARLLAELDLHMAAHVSGSRDAIRLDYFEPLQQALFKPLMGEPAKADPVKAATASIELLDAYGLSKDDMMVTMGDEVGFHPEGAEAKDFKEYLKGVDSKVKAAFTREYNKGSHRSQSLGGLPPGAVAAARGGKRGGGAGLSLGVTEDGDEVDGEDELVADEDLKDAEKDDDNGDDDKPTEKELAAFRKKSTRGKASAAGARGGRGGASRGARGGAKQPAGTKRKAKDISPDSDSDDGFIVSDSD